VPIKRHKDCSVLWSVKEPIPNLAAPKRRPNVDMVDLFEEMLYQRASCGIRPMLYLSSNIDLECSMLMLLDDTGEVRWTTESQPAAKRTGYHVVTN
jgi:hypothetical protein